MTVSIVKVSLKLHVISRCLGKTYSFIFEKKNLVSKGNKSLKKIRGRSTWQLNQKWDGIHLLWNELVVAKGFLNAGNNSFMRTVFSVCLWKSLLELDNSFGRCQLQGSKSLAYKIQLGTENLEQLSWRMLPTASQTTSTVYVMGF